MKINNFRIEEGNSVSEISADIGGVTLWYKIPTENFESINADPFVCAAFFPAMVSGENIEVSEDYPISRELVEGLYALQKILGCWNHSLTEFSINGSIRPAEKVTQGTATFFSGGVDSLYTLKSCSEEIDYTIYINGFDFDMKQEIFDKKYQQNKSLSEFYGKEIIPVQTNYNSMMYHNFKISRALHHGSCMASIAHLLGFEKVYIPSSYTYNQLIPFGSHPLTDHLWSSEVSKIVHSDASVARSIKTIEILKDKFVSDNLIVCWHEPDKNCGKCGKCLRTMMVLEIAGIESEAFPHPFKASDAVRLGCESFSDLSFFRENLDLAIAYDDKMVKPLKKAVRKNALKLYVKEYDNQFLGGAVKRAFKTLLMKKHYDDGLMRPKPFRPKH
jgi:hypothetical protein